MPPPSNKRKNSLKEKSKRNQKLRDKSKRQTATIVYDQLSDTNVSHLQVKYMGITLPLLEMADPYYPQSRLATSVFHGYYFLFFMFSVTFIVVQPFLNFMNDEDLFGKTVIMLIQTNLKWDFISFALFTGLAIVLTQISAIRAIPVKLLLSFALVTFVGGGVVIVRAFEMYFTDRIFIIVLSWAFGAKCMSYIYDKHEIYHNKQQNLSWQILQKQKNINNLSKRLLFFISPIVSYRRFVFDHDPALKIHSDYLITKTLVSFMCLIVNNILLLRFIQPQFDSDLFFVALIFKLTPLTLYINITLYYMVMDNVLAAAAQICQIKTRVFYLDWWNAETVSEFIEKWCLLLNQSVSLVIPKASKRMKRASIILVLTLMLHIIFGRSLNIMSFLIFVIIQIVIFFLGDVKRIQNNYIVHLLCMIYTPTIIALQIKYGVFD